MSSFPVLNTAYNQVFHPNRLSLGLVIPIEQYMHSAVPQLERFIERIQLAEQLEFSAVWLRDVPFNVPSFGDAGQIHDPFVMLGMLAHATQRIALGVASIILPLRHPAHIAKAASSADVLSNGRLLLGVASGDRPDEYPAMNKSFPDSGVRFRDSMDYIKAMAEANPYMENQYGKLIGNMDMLPKPTGGRIPMLITGGSQQDPDWVAQHGDGWMTYPRDAMSQARVVDAYRQRIKAAGLPDKPVMQSLYVDVLADADAPPRPIHLGFQSGTSYLKTYLNELVALGVNHVALNLRFNQLGIEETLHRLSDELLPDFTNTASDEQI